MPGELPPLQLVPVVIPGRPRSSIVPAGRWTSTRRSWRETRSMRRSWWRNNSMEGAAMTETSTLLLDWSEVSRVDERG